MRQRLERHLLAQLVTLGDHSISALLSTAGRQALDWSADYRMYSRCRIRPQQLFDSVRTDLLAQLPDDEPLVVSIDDTRVRKTGRKVAGAHYTRDPMGPRFQVNFIWAQRFVQASLAAGSGAASRARNCIRCGLGSISTKRASARCGVSSTAATPTRPCYNICPRTRT